MRRLALIEQERRTFAMQADPYAKARALERENAELRRQLAVLREQLAEVPESLRRVNDKRQAEAGRLKEAIASILAEHPQPDTLTAKGVLRALERVGVALLPSERTVLRHLTALRHGQTACVG